MSQSTAGSERRVSRLLDDAFPRMTSVTQLPFHADQSVDLQSPMGGVALMSEPAN